MQCDGVPQCPDLSDEVECGADTADGGCDLDQFRCDSGQCVEADMVCDGFYQCDDGSDEAKCKNNAGNKMST